MDCVSTVPISYQLPVNKSRAQKTWRKHFSKQSPGSLAIRDREKWNWTSFRLTLRRGGRDLINSRMTAWASFFTFGGMSPFTITLRKLYFLWKINEKVEIAETITKELWHRCGAHCYAYLDLMSSIKISYGVSSYSVGGWWKLIFFSRTPRRSSSTTCIQNLACENQQTSGINRLALCCESCSGEYQNYVKNKNVKTIFNVKSSSRKFHAEVSRRKTWNFN